MDRHKFIATTVRGLEDLAAEEVKRIVNKEVVPTHGGRVSWVGDVDDAFRVNYLSRSVHRVILSMVDDHFHGLDGIYTKFSSLDYSKYIGPNQTFAVVTKRFGVHPFSSIDVSRVVGQAIIDSYMKCRGVRLKVDLENPDVTFRVYVIGDRVFGGIDTTGQNSLHRRNYRVYQHPAALKTTIAYSLVRLSGWRINETLIDPMCGGGTIPIEAALWARNIPPGTFRKAKYAFERLTFLDLSKFSDIREAAEAERKHVRVRICGCDASERHVAGAILNAESAEVADTIDFRVCDARRVSLDYDRIVVNVPYGIRMGGLKRVGKLYREFISNLLGCEWRTLVVLVGSKLFLEEAKRRDRLKLVADRRIMYGSLRTYIHVFELE